MDHVNLDWLLENIDDSVEGAEQMRADLNRVTRHKQWTSRPTYKELIGDGQKISGSLPYITFCRRKYGRVREPGEEGYDSAVINRYSDWFRGDYNLPEIIKTVCQKTGVTCDGYFIDHIPVSSGLFHREIMLLNPGDCLVIDENNQYHTCLDPDTSEI